jgi:hypothetical protein
MDSDFVYPEKHKKLCTQYRVSENRLSLVSMYPENSCPTVCSPDNCNKAIQKGKKACLPDISISTILWSHILNILCPNICLDLFLQFSSNSISYEWSFTVACKIVDLTEMKPKEATSSKPYLAEHCRRRKRAKTDIY